MIKQEPVVIPLKQACDLAFKYISIFLRLHGEKSCKYNESWKLVH